MRSSNKKHQHHRKEENSGDREEKVTVQAHPEKFAVQKRYEFTCMNTSNALRAKKRHCFGVVVELFSRFALQAFLL